jgi:hypothetical protein
VEILIPGALKHQLTEQHCRRSFGQEQRRRTDKFHICRCALLFSGVCCLP